MTQIRVRRRFQDRYHDFAASFARFRAENAVDWGDVWAILGVCLVALAVTGLLHDHNWGILILGVYCIRLARATATPPRG